MEHAIASGTGARGIRWYHVDVYGVSVEFIWMSIYELFFSYIHMDFYVREVVNYEHAPGRAFT